MRTDRAAHVTQIAAVFGAVTLLASSIACKRDESTGSVGPPITQPAAPPLASKPFYRIDPAHPPTCTVDAVCEIRLVLTALGDYHVNDRYPFKLLVQPTPELAVEGTPTFVITGAKSGTMTVRARATRQGTTTLTGTFKLSVCNDDNCEIDEPRLSIAVSAS